MDMTESDRVRLACTRFLSHHYQQTPKQALLALAEVAGADEQADMYGGGELIAGFEARVAELLGKPAAVFLPSGTMAQQIALRVWTERSGASTVVMHARNHLDAHEQFGYQRLHGLRGVPAGSPERLLTLDDLTAVAEPIGALLLELPQRELGGLLPEWDDLVAQTSWARERQIPVHMDGARLWESAPYYERPYAEIAALFDSVYVSFYKGLGGLAGAALAGPADVIAEARVWQRRHGGNLIHLYPYVLAARQGLDARLERMPAYYAKAREVVAALRALPGVDIVPDPPQTRMAHVYLRGDAERLQAAALDVSRERGVWLFSRLQPTPLPAVQKFEFTAGDATLDLPTTEIVELLADVLERARANA